jgi:hypothetical protein
MSLNSQILLSLLTHEASSGDLTQSLRVTPVSYSAILDDTQAQVTWSDSRTLSGASNVINASSLSDERGTVTMTALKAVYLKNTSTAALTATPSPAGAFGGTYTIRPGGAAVAVASDATGLSVGTLTVAGSSGQTYDVVLIGEGTVS